MSNKIEIYLQKNLPDHYTHPSIESGEGPVESIDELCDLYRNKYGTFGSVTFYIYDEKDMIPFIIALNNLFKSQGNTSKVDARLLKSKINALVPIIVVDGEIISKGIYPELGSMRGGSNSISRGGDGHHTH